MSASSRPLWIYFLPALHLCACFISLIGYVIPSLQYLGIVWTYVMLADFPISAVALAAAWKHGTLAAAWILVIGTLWWYLLSRGVDLVVRKFKAREEAPVSKLG